jgi:predicted ribosome quality control (RQC) complex YloA/Tae2 family protein
MTYDGLITAAVIAELKRRIVGARIQSVRQHNDTDLTLEIRATGRTYRLFISVGARFPRVYLTATSESVPQTPPGFCMLLRKHIEGGFVTDIEQVRMDRIIVFRIGRGGSEPLSLTLEIMGKHSNLILLDHQGRILGAAKMIGSSVSRVRQILPGRDYLLPPGSDKLDIRDLTDSGFNDLWSLKPEDQSAADWLMSTFSGFGPFLAHEIAARGETADTPLGALTQLAESVRTEAFDPVFINDDRGRDLMVYPIHSIQYADSQQHPRASINEALDAFFRTLIARSELDDERAQLLTAIRRSIASRKQTLKSVERTLAESKNADRYRQIGELLMGNLNAIQKGAKSVALVDYFDPDMPEIDVELDEKLTPRQNAERYFKRFQKSRDAVDTSTKRRQVALDQLDLLFKAQNDAEAASHIATLRELRKMLEKQSLLRSIEPHLRHVDEFGGQRIRRIETPDGWEILYGESAQANDYLTQKVARPNDVWLHARSITGAHVVIRMAGRSGAPPQAVLLAASRIAARNSDAKNSSLVPVDHTLKKHVRKPRGSAPGFVIYTHEKTIDVGMSK